MTIQRGILCDTKRMLLKLLQILAYSVIPLLGILFLNWDWRQIIVLYWLENITVGIITLINIVTGKNTSDLMSRMDISGLRMITSHPNVLKSVMAAFFTLHYGMFTFIHGIFVFLLVSGNLNFGSALVERTSSASAQLELNSIIGLWAVVTIVHIAMVLAYHFAGLNKGAENARLSDPYKRILALHFSIIIGSFVIAFYDLPAASAIILIVMHALLDIFSFRKVAPPPLPSPDGIPT